MKVIITKNYEEMSAKAARFVLAHLWRKQDLALGLPTGQTPIGMYEYLAKAYKDHRADFSKARTFNLDEYVGVNPNNPNSYSAFMEKHLFSEVNLKLKNTYIPNGVAKDLSAECEQYENEITNSGGIDLQVLGIAPNGHIGFNEPGTQFASRTHVASLTSQTREKNKKHFRGEVPSQAITMGIGTIMESKKILLLASGKEKASSIADTIEGRVKKETPASVLQWHPDVTFIIDEGAASKLKRDYSSPFMFRPGDVELLCEKDLTKGLYITVISPHPDDASISCGGIISSLSRRNKVNIVIMTSGYRSDVSGAKPEDVARLREKEAREEAKILGSASVFLRARFYDSRNIISDLQRDTEDLTNILKRTSPDIVFLPHSRDSHPTHSRSREVAMLAVKSYKSKKPVQLWEYEGLWSLFAEGDFNTIFSYDESTMKKKIKAIMSQESQITRTRFDIASKSLARLRASAVPEQSLVGYGSKTPKLGKYFELFNINQML